MKTDEDCSRETMRASSGRTYRAEKRSVNKALDLLRSGQARTAANGRRKQIAKGDGEESGYGREGRISLHCIKSKSSRRKKRSVASSGLSRGIALLEMRKCLVRRDWVHLIELFPLLLEGRSDMEALTWRYALTALLCSPEANSVTLDHFFGMCVGGQTYGQGHFLQRLIALQTKLD